MLPSTFGLSHENYVIPTQFPIDPAFTTTFLTQFLSPFPRLLSQLSDCRAFIVLDEQWPHVQEVSFCYEMERR